MCNSLKRRNAKLHFYILTFLSELKTLGFYEIPAKIIYGNFEQKKIKQVIDSVAMLFFHVRTVHYEYICLLRMG